MRITITCIITAIFLLGNVRAQDESNKLNISAEYVGEYFQNFSGGLQTGQTYLGLLDFGLSFNTDDVGLWKNGEFNMLVENTHGGSPTGDYLGDIQVASNIENGDYTYLYEMWYKHSFSKLNIKLGLLDLNADCHVNDIGGIFLNSSFGIMPTASLNMPVPIFPLPALGVQLQYQATEKLSFVAGMWDGDPGDFETNRYNIEWTLDNKDGFLYMAESNVNLDKTILKFGGLYHSGTFEYLTDSSLTKKGNLSLHFIAEHNLTDEIDAFVQLGYATDKTINSYPVYYGAGINYKGVFKQDASDILGLGVASIAINESLRSEFNGVKASELALELSYLLPIHKNISIQPDFQYIVNPGAMEGINNSFIGFLRFYVTTN